MDVNQKHSTNQIHVGIFSDRKGSSRQIQDVLNADKRFVVTEYIGSVGQSHSLPMDSSPDLFIIRSADRPVDGLRWIVELRSEYEKVPIILISRGAEIVCTEKALRLGANGYVALDAEVNCILDAIQCVLAGDRYTSSKYSQWLIQRAALGRSTSIRHLLSDLSNQERRVFECIGEGHSNRTIAECIGIHAKTVATYRSRIKTKLGISDGQILAEIALEWKHAEKSR